MGDPRVPDSQTMVSYLPDRFPPGQWYQSWRKVGAEEVLMEPHGVCMPSTDGTANDAHHDCSSVGLTGWPGVGGTRLDFELDVAAWVSITGECLQATN